MFSMLFGWPLVPDPGTELDLDVLYGPVICSLCGGSQEHWFRQGLDPQTDYSMPCSCVHDVIDSYRNPEESHEYLCP